MRENKYSGHFNVLHQFNLQQPEDNWRTVIFPKIPKIQKSMEISNQTQNPDPLHQEIISQQQTLIIVLKEEIIRLQVRLIDAEKDRDENHRLHQAALDEIEILKDKLESLHENNESIMQTFKVFQREFVKRDYNIAPMSPKKIQKDQQPEVPLFMELVRTIRQKFNQPILEPAPTIEKSFLGQYYGYFLHEAIEQSEQQLYDACLKNKKNNVSKVKSYGRKNYFNEKYRHYFWYNALPNTLKISPKLYEHLLDRYNSNLQNEIPKSTIIDLDLRRMDFKIDQQRSESIKVQVKKCLQIFKLYRPDIGYVQGMSYLAWMLLIRLEGYEAFVCFANMILCDPFIHSLYLFNGDNIRKIMAFYEECLQDKRPKLAKHMKNLMVEPELFIIEWAYTMFSRAFSLRLSSKIWDLWFCEGFNVFFKVVMVIVEMLEPDIMGEKQNDRIIELLRTKTHRLDEVEFMRLLQKQKLFEDLKL